MKRPAGLERLAEYAETSPIPPLFAEAVGATWPKVRMDISGQRVESERFYREIADRLFRSQHPFKSELEANYAVYLGMSIALARRLGELAQPETIIWGLNYPKTYEQHELRGSIYPVWGHTTLCELRARPEYYSLTRSPLYRAKMALGLAPTSTHLESARVFVNDYYRDPSHTRDLVFIAGKV